MANVFACVCVDDVKKLTELVQDLDPDGHHTTIPMQLDNISNHSHATRQSPPYIHTIGVLHHTMNATKCTTTQEVVKIWSYFKRYEQFDKNCRR